MDCPHPDDSGRRLVAVGGASSGTLARWTRSFVGSTSVTSCGPLRRRARAVLASSRAWATSSTTPTACCSWTRGVSDPEVDAHYRPRRRPLVAALAAAGVRPDDIRLVVNCHLHFDHCGGNPELAGRVILAQRVELEAARTAGYTLPALVDAPGLRYEELDGEAEVLPGVLVLPTPGHTPGHQCLAVCRGDGTVVVAGQSHDTATAYGADVLSWRAGRAGHAGHEGHPPAPPSPPAWIERIQQLDPAHVVFAHDPRRLGALTLSSRNEPSERRLSAPGRGGGVAGPRRYAGRCRAPRGRARRATLPGGGVEQDHVGHADLPVAQHRFAERVQRGQGRPRVRPDQYRASDRRGS